MNVRPPDVPLHRRENSLVVDKLCSIGLSTVSSAPSRHLTLSVERGRFLLPLSVLVEFETQKKFAKIWRPTPLAVQRRSKRGIPRHKNSLQIVGAISGLGRRARSSLQCRFVFRFPSLRNSWEVRAASRRLRLPQIKSRWSSRPLNAGTMDETMPILVEILSEVSA